MRQRDCAPSWNWNGVKRGITSRPSLHLDEGVVRTRTRPPEGGRSPRRPGLQAFVPLDHALARRCHGRHRRSVATQRTHGRNPRGKDTAPELAVRRIAHGMGLRFRLHRRNMPGRPDLVFPRHRLAVFVHGCLWHQHQGCRFAHIPKSRVAFWKEKFAANVARDKRNIAALRGLGWRVLVIWECQVGNAALVPA